MSFSLSERYLRFAEGECGAYAPLYRDLARAVAREPRLLDFVAELPDPQPNLLFAAVQYLTGPASMPRSGAALADLVEERAPEIEALARTRSTQTNEVGRCTAFLPALPPGPLALIEVGASAGLSLRLHRYRYEYGDRTIGPADAPVVLRCTVEGGRVPLPGSMPEVVWRRGLDLHPVDVHDPDRTRWLLACVWADHEERRDRLCAAIEVARADPVPVLRGDLVDDLEPLVREAPAAATLVVLQAAVFPYVSRGRRTAFVELLARLSEARPIVWITDESPGLVPGLDAPPAPAGEHRFLLGRTRFSGGERTAEALAWSHPHGWTLSWLDRPEASSPGAVP